MQVRHLLLIPVAAAAVTAPFIDRPERASADGSAVPVKTETVGTHALPRETSSGGFVRGERQTTVSPRVSGYVSEILRREGDTVRAGETLAIISAPEYAAADEAARQVDRAAQEALRRAERLYDQKVDEAKAVLRKTRESRDKGDATDRDVRVAEEAVTSAERARDLQVQSARVQVAETAGQSHVAGVAQDSTFVRAPFSGILLNRSAEEGMWVSPGTPLFSIASPDPLEVEVSLPRSYASVLKTGMPAEVRTGDGKTFRAEVSAVAPSLGETVQQTGVRVRIGRDGGSGIGIGDYVQVRFSFPTGADGITVPQQAVVRIHDDLFVYAAQEDRARLVRIAPGGTADGNVAVTGGLETGDRIVVAGQYRLHDGAVIDEK